MLNCSTCTKYNGAGGCEYFGDLPGMRVCPYAEPKPHTNADRIRAMTDEELARFIAHYDSITEVGEQLAYERWLDWLRQEVDDGKTD